MNRYTAMLILVLVPIWAIAGDVLIADAKPGRWVEGKGVMVNLSTPDGAQQYAVFAKGTNGVYSVFPAEIEVEVPEGTLGRVCRLMVLILDDTPNDRAPRTLTMRVQGIKPMLAERGIVEQVPCTGPRTLAR